MTSQPSGPWVNEIELRPEQREELARSGAVKLEGLMTPRALEFLRELCATDELDEVTATKGGDGSERRVMASRGRNIGNKDPVLEEILRSPEFRRVMAHVVPEKLLFTKGMVFEIEPGDSGYRWHFGVKAFQFIRPSDVGYSLWIPLHEVGPRTGGGVAYAPAHVWSGRERVKLIGHRLLGLQAANPEKAKKIARAMGEEYPFLSFLRKYELRVLRSATVQPSFALGDVFLFSRFVWHRSCSFLPEPAEGEAPPERRVAYTIRLVDAESRISKRFIEGLNRYYDLRMEDGDGSTGGSGEDAPFEELEDGGLIRDSPDSYSIS